MSFQTTDSTVNHINDDTESNYGSDFSPDDIALLERLLIQANSESVPPLAIIDPDDEPGHGHFAYVPRWMQQTDDEDDANGKEVFTQSNHESNDQDIARLVSARLASPPTFGPGLYLDSEYQNKEFDDEALDSWDVWKDALPKSSDSVEPAQAIESIQSNQGIGTTLENALKSPSLQDPAQGTSPLIRFRSPPKKPLSVTDLVSPAWCELQYYFTLSRYGRVRPNVAMKRGSELHAKLEQEVFTKIQVPVQSREDSWALQLWNLITSLRTLRETGMTREMQVWGVLNGEVIAGVMDELRTGTVDDEKALQKEAELDLAITNQALLLAETRKLFESPERRDDRRVVFLTDMKTRASKSIPRGASLRGTIYQLMLYYTLFQDLISHKTDFKRIFERYRLDPLKPFTESFLEQMYGLADPNVSQPDPIAGVDQSIEPQELAQPQSQTHSIETPSSSFLRQMARIGDGTTEPSISAPSESNGPIGSQYSSISSLSPSQSFSQPASQSFSQPASQSFSQPASQSFSQPASQPSNTNSGSRNNHPHIQPITQTTPYTPTPLSPSSLFHRHNTLSSLLTLLSREITLTFPHGSSSLSPYLHACYRDKNTGEITGRRVFMYDEETLSAYVSSEMAWWKGTRESRGVQIEEAFKCNMCEFAAGCGWRAGMQDKEELRRRDKADAATQRHHQQHQQQTQTRIPDQTEPDREASDAAEPEQDPKPRTKIPGEWISETGSEAAAAVRQRDGIAVDGGRKGEERSRSIV